MSAPSSRDHALDATKGALVLLMVLYHWLNYFYSTEGFFYRYIRFITPSFIFLTGFLISHVSLARASGESKTSWRLLGRGARLFGLFCLLNVGIALVAPNSYNGQIRFLTMPLGELAWTLLTGTDQGEGGKAAAFFILLPISYLLFAVSGLIAIAPRKNLPVVLWSLVVSIVTMLSLVSWTSATLELLAVGLLGLALGYYPLQQLFQQRYFAAALALCFLLQNIALTLLGARFSLQVTGVVINCLVIYALFTRIPGSEMLTMLGRYSLFAYIGQVLILQLLRRGFTVILRPDTAAWLLLSALGAYALTVLAVAMLDRTRRRSGAVNTAYQLLFT